MHKKILVHIITNLNTGGAERALYNLLNDGLAEKFNCHVISLMGEGTIGLQILALGVPVTALDMKNSYPSLGSLKKLLWSIRKIQPDIIQGWMYHGNLIATLARTFVRKDSALAWNIRHSLYDLSHEKFMTKLVIRLNRLFSTSTDALLYNSQLSQKQHESFGFSYKKGKVIPNGIDLKEFKFSSEFRHNIRLELDIPDSSIVVGHVARFHPIKDHSLFLKSAVNIAQNNKSIHFLLSGRDVSMINDEIRQLIPEELNDRFHLLNERSDVCELMCAMDIFCLSSWSEAFPNVIGEAMASGVPCVATDVGDCRMIIGDTGVIVLTHAKKEFIQGIDKLLILTYQVRQILGKKARVRIEENFASSEIVEQYTALYNQLLLLKE